jgi:hypothetical protein
MNTLTELRRTLDEHAAQLPEGADPASVARTAAVHHRVAEVRRRRRALGTGALALVLVAGVATAIWPRNSQPGPAGPVVLGQHAPATLHSVGYTFEATGSSHVVHGRGTYVVPSSRTPQLLTWTTDRPTTVRFSLNDEVRRTRVTGFRDFLWLPAGIANKVHVVASGADVGLATYAVGGHAPAGYTKAGVTYRDVVAGAPLLAARIGDEGESSVTTTFTVPRGATSIGIMCARLPHGDVVNLSVDGDGALSAGACDSDGTFDPGSVAYPRGHVGKPGQTVRVRVWVSRGFHDQTPLAAGSVPGLTVGVGVYGPVAQQRVAGVPVPVVIEDDGHLWRLATSRSQHTGSPVSVPAADVDRVAAAVWRTHGHTMVSFGVQSQTPEGSSSPGGQGGMSDLWVPAGSSVHASVSRGTGVLGIAVYERAD